MNSIIALSCTLLTLSGAGTSPPAERAPDAVVVATGVGRPPAGATGAQARLMAQRAAEVVALRNLAAKLHTPNGTSRPGHAETRLQAFIRGHEFLPAIEKPDGSVEVTVRLPLRTLGENYRTVAQALQAARQDVQRERERLAAMRRDMLARIDNLAHTLEAVGAELYKLREELAGTDPAAPGSASDRRDAKDGTS